MFEQKPSAVEAKIAALTFGAYLFDLFIGEKTAKIAEPEATSMEDIKRLFSYDEAAEYLSFSVRSLQTYVADGRLRTTPVGKRGVRFDRRELDRFADELISESEG